MTSSRLQVVIGSSPIHLLQAAAEPFLNPPPPGAGPFHSPPCLLALRQGGLRDDLYSLAARDGVPGWFDPAICIFHELPKWLGSTDFVPCDDVERAVLIGQLLRELGGQVFGRVRNPEAFTDSILRLFGELVSEGVTADSFDQACASRTDRDDFQQRRDTDLTGLYRAYLDRLASTGRRDGRDTWLDCANALVANPGFLTGRLRGRREIRLVGLQDLRNGWRPLLHALATHPALDRVLIFTSTELDLGAGLDATVERLDGEDHYASQLFTTAVPPSRRPAVQVLSAPDPERELEEVARRVRDLLDAGTPAHSIAIVSRQSRPYNELALRALDRLGVPATARRRVGLLEVPVVRAFRALVTAAAEGWTRHALVELAEQPYFAAELNAGILNFEGFRRRHEGLEGWGKALEQLLAEAEAYENEDGRTARRQDGRHGRRLPPSASVKEALEGFTRFAERARVLDRRLPLAAWLDCLDGLLRADPWGMRGRMEAVPADRYDVVRLDLTGWRTLGQIVTDWRSALGSWGDGPTPMDAAGFQERLDAVLDLDVALWTPIRGGVQVLEGLAAAYRPFDHLFLVGLETGRFPVRAPQSPILDEREREALRAAGLPIEPAGEWDRLERELFRVLVAGAGQLTVSFSRVDPAGREVIQSAFLEALGDVAELQGASAEEELAASRVLTPGARIVADAAAAPRAERSARIELDRASGRLSPWNGLIEEPALLERLAREFGEQRHWSPTQLEELAKCPWAFFSKRLLRVERLEDPEDDLDPAVRGTVLHDALRRFFEGEQTLCGGPVLLRLTDRTAAAPRLLAALDAALAASESSEWLGHPALRDARRAELQRALLRYLDAELELNEKWWNNRTKRVGTIRTAVTDHELEFEDLWLEREGIRFRFRGTIDRVEQGVDERAETSRFVAALDYKSSKYAVPAAGKKEGWEDGVVLQVPLYAHALAQLRPGSTPARVEYRSLRDGEQLHTLDLWTIDKKTGELSRDPEAAAKLESALDAAAHHVQGAREGRFTADPPHSCNCPPFCHAIAICRVAGGPRLDKW